MFSVYGSLMTFLAQAALPSASQISADHTLSQSAQDEEYGRVLVL